MQFILSNCLEFRCYECDDPHQFSGRVLSSAFIHKYIKALKNQKNILIQENVISQAKQKLTLHYQDQEAILKSSFQQSINCMDKFCINKEDQADVFNKISELHLSTKAADT